MSLFCSALSTQLLKGKKVLVTGGGRGIGRAIALICHDEGADVIVTSRTKSELEETVDLAHCRRGATAASNNENENDDEGKQKRLKQSAVAAALLSRRGGRSVSSRASGKATSVGARRTGTATKARMGQSAVSQIVDAVKTGSSSMADNGDGSDTEHEDDSCDQNRMTYYVCDVTDESQVESMVTEIVNGNDGNGGDIDILINNAGGSQSPKGPVGTLENRNLEDLLKLNVVGPQLITSAVCKYSPAWASDAEESKNAGLSKQKVILNISSKAGKVGLQNYSFYVATKFALEGLTSSWSKELASRNIRVHSISPGMINTRSFPKPTGKKGVREAASIRDCLLLALTGSVAAGGAADAVTNVVEDMMDYTGHYIHVDEYDQLVNKEGIEKAHLAFKAIDEDPFIV
eukprot:CAMPEP_0197185256 /NCGR_PEP_ID=MMETSP1423-20130617/11549_1 /TAXON_ID=476441 /ORGANISM="Pseudo-nitzschia heimii, Strain UNC1101" /LENGTH=403 /DNA_ID=CAMNT_0042636275 /DNA_START=184 /DNA_END=1395 /DNA_ORIENTATION=-